MADDWLSMQLIHRTNMPDVLCHCLRCGVLQARKATEVHDSIRTDKLTFAGRAWSKLSVAARELVGGMLEKDPKRRYTLDQALAHPWVSGGAAPDDPIDTAVVESMVAFNKQNRLRKAALKLVASTLTAAQLKELRMHFFAMDTDTDMEISVVELAQALERSGMEATGQHVQRLMEAMDTDGDGKVNLDEFLAATADRQLQHHHANMMWAFTQYDSNKVCGAAPQWTLGAPYGIVNTAHPCGAAVMRITMAVCT